MNQTRSIVKALLPRRVRRFLRVAHRAFVFRRAMIKFLKVPESCTRPGNPVVTDLIYGWGNISWGAKDEYLASCIEHALNSNGPILECGSGLSTILVGAIAKRRGLYHWTLEHKQTWATRVKGYLNRYNIDSVVLHEKPLKDYGKFLWYDPPLKSMPESFNFVICDGPPGITKGGRFGLVPIMSPRFHPGCIILLDDAHREQELAIARRWESELNASFEILGCIKPYIKMTVYGN